jgi:hypothetical protein
MRTKSTRPTLSRMTGALADAWADCRHASRRQVELQMGLSRRPSSR